MKFLYSLVALAAIASPVTAQRVKVYEGPRAGAPGTTTYTTSRRAVLGIMVDLRPSDNDSTGATISGVTPGWAGRRGRAAGGGRDHQVQRHRAGGPGRRIEGSADEADQSAPGSGCSSFTSRMSPGDTVTVEWKRERERNRRTARVVAEAAGGMVFSGGPDFRVYTDEGPGRFRFNFEDGPRGMTELDGRLKALRGPMAMSLPRMSGDHLFLRLGGPFGGIQFAPLNADLGRYFGTAEGILVLETPDTSAHVDLKGGDVILSIGDRKPTSVEHLFRILGSYQDEETIRFEVMRDKRRVTVEARAEDIRGGGRMRVLERRMLEGVPVPDRDPAPVERTAPRRAPRSGT